MDNIKPVRLQRKRVKGFKLISPNGLPIVYVGRPSRWGNPVLMDTQKTITREEAIRLYRRILDKVLLAPFNSTEKIEDWFRPLIGKNLSCWCPLDRPCHADVLLEYVEMIFKKARLKP